MVSKIEIRFYFLTRNSLKKDSEAYWKNECGSEIIMTHGSSNSCGVAILVKKDVDCTIHSKILDPLGIYVILKATKCMFLSMFMPLTKTQISLNFLFRYL